MRADVASYLAAKDAEIAAARARRMGLQGKAVAMGAHKAKAAPVESVKTRLVRLLLTGEALNAQIVAPMLGVRLKLVQDYLADLAGDLAGAGVAVEDTRRQGPGPAGTLRIIDIEAAKAVLT